ncbi:glyoxalase/bleomycin resistance protein/dioxygenase superfamily [Renibacterium salmoninarum ATCC 33209]|uniref:Glyoxalase/bleomycin resistance protein/dioxygenase superfamily n=3 Tax=Renibacterium salmoninarum TaxID=1646 RepID=A9WQE9_RENSM|nr:glyoxalase/bleomycin resistance protein/dioxygenase superfamily [Renibacterium salmoninarum ATCC 33209]
MAGLTKPAMKKNTAATPWLSRTVTALAGLMKNDGQSGYPDLWTTYLRSEDIDKTAELTTANGGQVIYPPMDVPEQGKMMLISAPDGSAVGVWEFGGHTGFQAHGETGTSSWHELHSRDYNAALPFYQAVFGWDYTTMGDSDEFRYSTVGEGDAAVAGLMDSSSFLPEGTPSNWEVYFSVENADQTLAEALALGAQVVQPLEDTPFGRLGSLTDPTGALFKLIQNLG